MAAEHRPESEEELARTVAEAARTRTPLRVRGGGTRLDGFGDGLDAISTTALNGIVLYEPGALTLVARAGTPLAEVEATLAAEGQRLAFEPMDHRPLLGTTGEPTIGGVAAANASGPRRIQAGAARDFLLGIRFVDGTGTVVRNGGRVMKNVTGYDLVKLLAGSWGTLGILTEVALKVLPRAGAVATLRLDGLDVAQSVSAMSAALASPYEVSGAARTPEGVTLLRIEGFATSVAYRSSALLSILGSFGPVHVDQDEETHAEIWRGVRDAAAFAGTEENVWLISVRPSLAPEVARRLDGARLLLDWGGGRIWAATAPGVDARAAMRGIVGHATLVRAAPEERARLARFQPEPAAVAALSRGLRQRFDPHGILNRALMEASPGAT